MFNYSYKQKDITGFSKKRLQQEARRLSNLVKRRKKGIEKRGLKSYSLEILKSEQRRLRDNPIYKKNIFSIYKDLNEQDLVNIIKSYDKFLTSKTSTFQQIEVQADRKRTELEKRIGKELEIVDWAKVNYVLDNLESANNLVDLLGSEQIVSSVLESDKTADVLVDDLENYFNKNQELSFDELETIFG